MTLTIEHTEAEGTLLLGTSRGDGSAEVVKALGWRWGRSIGLWFVPRSRDTAPKRPLIEQTARQLREAGFEVEVSIDTTTGDREAAEARSSWHTVARCNTKTVAVETGYSWTNKAPWHKIQDHRRHQGRLIARDGRPWDPQMTVEDAGAVLSFLSFEADVRRAIVQALAVNLARTFPTVVQLALDGDKEGQLDQLRTVTLGDWARVSDRDAEDTQLILGSYLGWIVSAYTVTGYSRGEDGRVRWLGEPADDFAGLIGTELPGGDWRRGQARPLRKVTVSPAPGRAEVAMKDCLVEMVRYNHDPERRRIAQELEDQISVRVQLPDTVMIRVPAGMKVFISPKAHELGRDGVAPGVVSSLLAYALSQGIAYVEDVRTGECPPWPLAGRLGWRRIVTETDVTGAPSKYRMERCGIRLGYIMHDPGPKGRDRVLMCEPTQLQAVIAATAATKGTTLPADQDSVCRSMLDEDVLIPDVSEGRTRYTTKCHINAEARTARMVLLRLDPFVEEETS